MGGNFWDKLTQVQLDMGQPGIAGEAIIRADEAKTLANKEDKQ